jgi:hypothetical protein
MLLIWVEHAVVLVESVRCLFMPQVGCLVWMLLLGCGKMGWYLQWVDVGRQLSTLVVLTVLEGGQQVVSVTVLKLVGEREQAALEGGTLVPHGLQYIFLPVM